MIIIIAAIGCGLIYNFIDNDEIISITKFNVTDVEVGNQVNIYWTCSDKSIIGNSVVIGYFPKNLGVSKYHFTEIETTENDGYYTWVVPSELDGTSDHLGAIFTLQVRSLDGKHCAESNELHVVSFSPIWIELIVPPKAWTHWLSAPYANAEYSAIVHGVSESEILKATWFFGDTESFTLQNSITSTTLPVETHYYKIPGMYTVRLDVTLTNNDVISNSTIIEAMYPENITIDTFEIGDPYGSGGRSYQIQFTLTNLSPNMIDLYTYLYLVYEGGIEKMLHGVTLPQLLPAGGSIVKTGWGEYVTDESQPLIQPIGLVYGFQDYMYIDLNEPTQNPWQTSVVFEASQSKYCDVALDADNNLYISTISYDGSYYPTLAAFKDGSWTYSRLNVDNSFTAYYNGYSSIAINAAGNAFVCYVSHAYDGSIVLARMNGDSTLDNYIIDSYLTDDVNVHPKLVLNDQNTEAYIAYVDGNQLIYKIVTFVSNTQYYLDEEIIETGISNSLGWDIDLVLDSNGYVHISYYDAINCNLKYATNSGGSWITTIVDSADDAGEYSTVAVDENGIVYIAYSSGSLSHDLKYAIGTVGNMQIITLDDDGNTGLLPSIDIVGDHVAISYYDARTSDLKLALFNGFSWSTQRIGDVTDYNGQSTLAFDSHGSIYVVCSEDNLIMISMLIYL